MTLFDGSADPLTQASSVGRPTGVADVTHDVVRDQMSDFLEGSLPERERRRLEEHLAQCQQCRIFQETLAATNRAVASLPRVPAPRSLRERLLQLPDA